MQPLMSLLGRFLRENWLWILAPVVVTGLLVLSLALSGPAEGDAPFLYALF